MTDRPRAAEGAGWPALRPALVAGPLSKVVEPWRAVRVVADVFTPVAAVSSYKETEVEWVKTNHVKRALREGRPTAGSWLHLCSVISAEIMSRAGFDWLLIDMEHGHGDYQMLLGQLQAIEGCPVIPIVRVQWNDPAVVKRVLDLGAYGVMVPWVGSRAEAEAAVRATKYPPEGVRGIAGSHRASGYGRHAAEYWKRANEEILVVVQIETRGALAEIGEIVRVPGIDVVFVGPADLSAALGHVGDPA